jgi:hypothetical protein
MASPALASNLPEGPLAAKARVTAANTNNRDTTSRTDFFMAKPPERYFG